MKKLVLIILALALLMVPMACAPAESEPPVPNPDEWKWYMPNYPDMLEPELDEDLSYWDWGTLLPNEEEITIGEGEGWVAYKRGSFEGYSILFALSARGIHRPDWRDRLVEVYSNYAVEIVMQDKVAKFTMDARKYSDGTYSYSDYGTGIFHIDSKGKTLHKYLDENNGHESLVLSFEPPRILSYSFETGVARITDWQGNIYWEWNQEEVIIPFSSNNYANLEYHYGTKFAEDGIPIYKVYDPIETVKTNQHDGGIGLNRVQVLENGHKILSLRNVDLVLEIDENNKTVWSFGPTILRHQHCPTLLDNGNLLVHDTGNNRILEVTKEHEIVFEFQGGMVCPYMGMVQRLPDGDTVFSDGLRTTVTCVTPAGEVVWEVYIKGKDTLTRTEALKHQKKVLPGFRIYRAWCYLLGFGDE